MTRRRTITTMFIDSFTSGLDELPQVKQKSLPVVLRALHENHRQRFSVFEATANRHIAKTMTTICQDGFIKTDNRCGYPWTEYKLTAKGLAAIGVKQ